MKYFPNLSSGFFLIDKAYFMATVKTGARYMRKQSMPAKYVQASKSTLYILFTKLESVCF